MIETIKTILLDFISQPLNTGIYRQNSVKALPGKAAICIGVRRCGKSTLMFQIMQGLIDNGVPKENILYLNFFDDRLHDLQHSGLGKILEAYYLLHPEKKNTEKVFCFFDEIQVIPGWETFIERMLRTENCEIYITGSSADMLSKEIATQMRGRALSWEIFPFSFKEYLDFKSIKFDRHLSTKSKLHIQKAFEEYWQSGGFPEVLGLDQHLRTKIHQEYYQAILFKDLIERHNISHPKAVSDLTHRLIDNVGSLYSINALTGYLQSLSHKVPKTSVSTYIDWFEDTYFLFTVRVFDASLTKSKVAAKKIYCIDHAFINSISSGILVNSGHLLENIVFTHLRRKHESIFYYKTKNHKEVDFIVNSKSKGKILVQVCESLSNDKTRNREISALEEAMKELNISHGTIVTRNENEIYETGNKTIHIVPAWRYLLEEYLD